MIGRKVKDTLIIGRIGLVASTLLLAACGGESSSPQTPTPTSTNSNPRITSSNTATVAENVTGSFYTVSGADNDGDALTFSIIAGNDSGLFSLNGSALSFVEAPNFDLPSDSDLDNIYRLTLGVSDGRGGTSSLNVSVTVQNDKEGISVTRIATGLVGSVGITPTFSSDRAMAVGMADGSYILFNGDRAATAPLAAPVVGVPGGGSFVRMLDLAWGPDGTFWRGPMFLFESSFAFSILRPESSQTREGNLTFGSDPNVSGKLFIGESGEALASLSDEAGSFAQAPPFPTQDRFGRIFRLEPGGGASTLGLGAKQIANGVQLPGGFAEIGGLTSLADQGTSVEHEINLLGADIFALTSNPLNLGWPFREGTNVLQSGEPAGLLEPALTYPRGTGPREGAGIVFGVAYAGAISGILGDFVFGDTNGSIFTIPVSVLTDDSFHHGSELELRNEDFAPDVGTIDSVVEIAADASGILYILDEDGEIFRVDSL